MIDLTSHNDRHLFFDAFLLAQQRVRSLIEGDPDFYPMYTSGGKWRHELPPWTYWCDGFLPGMMWVFAASDPDESSAAWWREHAIRYTRPLEPRKQDGDVHDLGFIFMTTFYRWFELSGDQEQNDVLVQAARTLATRYQPKGRYLASFVSTDSLLIDIMMNVGLLFHAALETSSTELMDVAMQTCLTARRKLIRGDGSVAQVGIFDPDTGAFLRQSTHQGYRADSCWSRGLAWALYGFGNAFEYCGDARLVLTAEACADFYIHHCPSDGVPLWDFDVPHPGDAPVDTSAAAIAASGLFKLARVIPDITKGHLYGQVARRILRSLCENHLATDNQSEGILLNGVYHMHQKLGVNESVIWGDHYFVEALDEALRHEEVLP
jgi:unsaturated chondroitin disaccharide hydrolase